jgi:hypothetical protein
MLAGSLTNSMCRQMPWLLEPHSLAARSGTVWNLLLGGTRQETLVSVTSSPCPRVSQSSQTDTEPQRNVC